MKHSEPLHAALRRQATYALTAFVSAAIAFEMIVPGAVLPIVDIVPWAFVAAALLAYDAARRPTTRRTVWVGVMLKLVCALCVMVALWGMFSWDGRAGMVAAGVMGVGVVSLAFWREVVE